MSVPADHSRKPVGVIDIFAGPGGLGEGFSSFEANSGSCRKPFHLAVSAEMEKSAHATLRLRAFVRLLQEREGQVPAAYAAYLADVAGAKACSPAERFGAGRHGSLWRAAEQEALNLTMGDPEHNRQLHDRISAVRMNYDRLILIGGPPCQAYSVVGRARQRNVSGFLTKGDHRHFLYKQYLGILAEFAPEVFIMENVKGILTSKVGKTSMFPAIQRDLSNPAQALGMAPSRQGAAGRYVLLPIHVDGDGVRCAEKVASDPSGFVIRCEDHGVPQARHRVIIMGVREDCLRIAPERVPGLAVPGRRICIEEGLSGLPRLRSGVSREVDDSGRWRKAMETEQKRTIRGLGHGSSDVREALEAISPSFDLPRRSSRYTEPCRGFAASLRSNDQRVVLNHETRGHMPSDLGRYMFCAAYAAVRGRSPSSADFPRNLAPDHYNWDTGAFSDRFRVQMMGRPASTVTSHLSKDGHAFIHWDPAQCRSLTVREAARLQTFSDDYLFLGNRTQQYVQVGNAVPPLISKQIARVVWDIIG